MNPELSRFVWEHRNDDPFQLSLARKQYPGVPVAEAAAQVEALQKTRQKVPSWYREGMLFPPRLSMEQASSEAAARFKAGLVPAGRLLDLTCGLGIDTYFFSKVCTSVTAIEQNPVVANAARHNFSVLGADNIQVITGDSGDFETLSPGNFDSIYLDPARRDQQQKKVFNWSDCSPDLLALKDKLLSHTRFVLVKAAPMLDIHLSVRQLENVQKVWIVEYAGEVKEVLYQLGAIPLPAAKIPVEVTGIDDSGQALYRFEYTAEAEKEAVPVYSAPLGYLYEPSPALLKSGAVRLFGKRYGLAKLHENTHLFTSEQLTTGVPGRCFEIISVCRYDKKEVQAAVPGLKASIATRNFPDAPEVMARKLGLGAGGSVYLFGVTLCDNRKVVLICRKPPQHLDI